MGHDSLLSNKRCSTCGHLIHLVGQCKQCNCGDSTIIRTDAFNKLTLCGPGPFKGGSTMTLYGYDRGHRVPRRKTDN